MKIFRIFMIVAILILSAIGLYESYLLPILANKWHIQDILANHYDQEKVIIWIVILSVFFGMTELLRFIISRFCNKRCLQFSLIGEVLGILLLTATFFFITANGKILELVHETAWNNYDIGTENMALRLRNSFVTEKEDTQFKKQYGNSLSTYKYPICFQSIDGTQTDSGSLNVQESWNKKCQDEGITPETLRPGMGQYYQRAAILKSTYFDTLDNIESHFYMNALGYLNQDVQSDVFFLDIIMIVGVVLSFSALRRIDKLSQN